MEESNHVVGFVGRCTGCKLPVRVDLSEERRETYRYTKKVRLYKLQGGGWHEGPSTATTTTCPHCGASTKLKRLKASYNPEVKCGAKCRCATGPNCDCSCRGVNHGRG